MNLMKSMVATVTLTFAATTHADLFVQNLGTTPGGNWEWAVMMQPVSSPAPPNPMAVEVGVAVFGSTIASTSLNGSTWTLANPGNPVFGWEVMTPSANNKPVGLQTRNGVLPPTIVFSAATANIEIEPHVVAGLVGDYNNNGIVDAADFPTWAVNVGTNNTLPNDSIGGTIGMAQYDQWRARFGNSVKKDAEGSAEANFTPGASAQIFAALGSLGVPINGATEVFRFQTLGRGAVTVEWGGIYGNGVNSARFAQLSGNFGVNFDTSRGSISAVPEPAALAPIALSAVLASVVNGSVCRRRFAII
jgi:hypothetical protein